MPVPACLPVSLYVICLGGGKRKLAPAGGWDGGRATRRAPAPTTFLPQLRQRRPPLLPTFCPAAYSIGQARWLEVGGGCGRRWASCDMFQPRLRASRGRIFTFLWRLCPSPLLPLWAGRRSLSFVCRCVTRVPSRGRGHQSRGRCFRDNRALAVLHSASTGTFFAGGGRQATGSGPAGRKRKNTPLTAYATLSTITPLYALPLSLSFICDRRYVLTARELTVMPAAWRGNDTVAGRRGGGRLC